MAELDNPNVMSNLITFLSSLIQKVAESNDLNCGFQAQKISVFHGLTRPTISIQSYLHRIYKYANCSRSCFIVAYVYLDRFAQRQPSLPINSFNVHRLLITSALKPNHVNPCVHFIFRSGQFTCSHIGVLESILSATTSVMVAAKFMDDMYYNNAFYAKVGGISTTEMNFLEVDFFFGLGFHLNVNPKTFHTYYSYLQRQMMMMLQPPPPSTAPESSIESTLKVHLCFSDEESTSHQKEQVAI
ncbi:hypothetical protein V6Z12_D08G070100 [Gossypium hirsutum]